MTVLRSIVMAFACFSKLPVPHVAWKNENMRYMLAALPLVGIVIGLLLIGWRTLCHQLGWNDVLFACGFTLLPLFVTGGIHMDGFCDTVDALNSHASPARKLAILKDPHPGAFAVIYTVAWFLADFGLATQLRVTPETTSIIALLPVMSRTVGGYAALRFPLAGEGGMLADCRNAATVRPAVVILLATFVLCTAGMALISPVAALGIAAAAALCVLYVRQVSVREFSGMRGDLVGYLIAVSELAMLAVWILMEGIKIV